MKYWILKQIDYDYSLLNIEESTNSPLDKEGLGEIWNQIDSSSSLHSSSEWQINTQETPIQEQDSKDDEDLRNRAKIFRTF